MQLELFRETAASSPAAPLMSPPPAAEAVPADSITDTQSGRTSRLLVAAQPRARLVAALAAPSFPAGTTTVEDLTQDLLVDVLGRAAGAPPPESRRFAPWLSSTLLAAAAARRASAKREELSARAGLVGPCSPADAPEDGEVVETVDRERSPGDAHRRAVREVLRRLRPDEALLLAARAEGESWATVGRRLRCSARTAARRHEEALTSARRLALSLDLGAPAETRLMLPGAGAIDAAA